MPFDGVAFSGVVLSPSLEKLDGVIDLLSNEAQWCKGALRSHDGRYCIRGAVKAVGATEMLEPQILYAIGEVAGKRFRRIESFNDHPNTSHEQVLAVLERTRENMAAGRLVPVVRTTDPPAPKLRERLVCFLMRWHLLPA